MGTPNLNVIKLFSLLTFMLLNGLMAQTNQWRLTWDMNSETDITEYKVYRYTSDQHYQMDDSLYAIISHTIESDSSEINLGDSTITYYDRRVKPGPLFNYKVKAVNTEDIESDYSDYVSAAIPEINPLPAPTIDEGQTFPNLDLDNYITDEDHTTADITWTVAGQSELNVSINPSNHNLIVLVPHIDWYGSETLTLTATDPSGFWDTAEITYLVNPVSESPTISGSTQHNNLVLLDTTLSLMEDTPYFCSNVTWFNYVEDQDTDDSVLIYTIKPGNHIARLPATGGQVLNPSVNFCSKDTLKLIISDGTFADSAYFVADVYPVNDMPTKAVLTNPANNTFVQYQGTLRFQWSASVDADGEAVNYDLVIQEQNTTDKISFNNITATHFDLDVRSYLDSGIFYTWNVETSDGHVEVVSDTSLFYMIEAESPSIAGTGQYKNLPLIDTTITMTEDTPVTCPNTMWYDFVEDGDTEDSELSYTVKSSHYITPTPTQDGQILTPVVNFCKNDTLKLVVSDGVLADSAYFVVTVSPVNDQPEKSNLISPVNNSAVAYNDSLLFLWSTASDPDDDTINYQLVIREEETENQIFLGDFTGLSSAFNVQQTFDPGVYYTWNVTASDGQVSIQSDTSVFHIIMAESPSIAGSGQFKNLSLIDTTIVLTEDTPASCPNSIWYTFVEDGDTEDSELTYIVRDSRNILKIPAENGCLLNPVLNFCTTDTLKLVVSDGVLSDSAYFVVDVIPVNDAPEQSQLISPIHNTALEYSDSITFQWSASFDPDDEFVLYNLTIREENSENEITIPDIIENQITVNIPSGFSPGAHYSWNVTSRDLEVAVVSDTAHFYVIPSTDIEDPWHRPDEGYHLSQNYPNPFNPTTAISYNLADDGYVTIEVYNTLGQQVQTLVDAYQNAGQHSVEFDSQGLSSGLYFYHIRSKEYFAIRKMILRK